MKVLFVSSIAKRNAISPFTLSQGNSLQDEGLDLKFFKIRTGGVTGYIKSIYELKKNLKKENFEIVHAHYGLSGIVSFFAKRKERLVVSFMGDDILGSNNYNGSITFSSRLIIFINRLFANLFYDHIIIKSEKMKDNLKNEKLSVIPNGINLNRFFPIEKAKARKILKLEQEKNIFIFVSDPKRSEKNFILAKSAFEVLNDPNTILLVVNGIDHSYLNYYYNAADGLLLTSFHEGSPNVIKEAMACNCPVISTNVGDVSWVIDGVEGCYLCEFDKNDLAQKIIEVINFSKNNRRTNGRNKIITLGLDEKEVAKKIIKIYESLIN